jgi:hypothetical protein
VGWIGINGIIGIAEKERGVLLTFINARIFVQPIGDFAEPFDIIARMRWQAKIPEKVIERSVLHHDYNDGFY